MSERAYLECPCCGCEGAFPGKAGTYYDGQPLVCGCRGRGHVSVSEDDVYIWIEPDEDCPHEDKR